MVDPSSSVINNLQMRRRWWCWWPIKIFRIIYSKVNRGKCSWNHWNVSNVADFIDFKSTLRYLWQFLELDKISPLSLNQLARIYCKLFSYSPRKFNCIPFMSHSCCAVWKGGISVHFLALSNSCISHTWRFPFFFSKWLNFNNELKY